MYLHLGNGVTVPSDDLVAIFDLDSASASIHTRRFLEKAQEEGMIFPVGDDLPKSMVVCCPRGSWQRVYLSPMAPATLQGRVLGGSGLLPQRPPEQRELESCRPTATLF